MPASEIASQSRRVALVTGAAGILGPCICSTLKEAGWIVVAADLADRNFTEHENLHGHPVAADFRLSGDLSNRNECRRLIEQVREKAGPLHLLINNATGHTRSCRLKDVDQPYCEQIFQVDLLAPIFLVHDALPDLRKTRGSIINISSVRAERPVPGTFVYSAAKAAVEKLTEGMAIELAPDGIRVNTIRVGHISGDAFLRPAFGMLPQELARQLYQDIMPLHVQASTGSSLVDRPGTPSDIAQMVLHLTSPTGEFINGAILAVDGGFCLRPPISPSESSSPSLAERWLANPKAELQNWLKAKGIDHEIA